MRYEYRKVRRYLWKGTLHKGSKLETCTGRARPAAGRLCSRSRSTSVRGLRAIRTRAHVLESSIYQRCEAVTPFGARLRDRWTHLSTSAGRHWQASQENMHGGAAPCPNGPPATGIGNWAPNPARPLFGPCAGGAMGLKIEISPNMLKTRAEGPLRKAVAEWRG